MSDGRSARLGKINEQSHPGSVDDRGVPWILRLSDRGSHLSTNRSSSNGGAMRRGSLWSSNDSGTRASSAIALPTYTSASTAITYARRSSRYGALVTRVIAGVVGVIMSLALFVCAIVAPAFAFIFSVPVTIGLIALLGNHLHHVQRPRRPYDA